MDEIQVENLPYKKLTEVLMKIQSQMSESDHIREANDYYEIFNKAKNELNERHEKVFQTIDIYRLFQEVLKEIPESEEDEREAVQQCINILDDNLK